MPRKAQYASSYITNEPDNLHVPRKKINSEECVKILTRKFGFKTPFIRIHTDGRKATIRDSPQKTTPILTSVSPPSVENIKKHRK
jgi:hypothetical protein